MLTYSSSPAFSHIEIRSGIHEPCYELHVRLQHLKEEKGLVLMPVTRGSTKHKAPTATDVLPAANVKLSTVCKIPNIDVHYAGSNAVPVLWLLTLLVAFWPCFAGHIC